MADTGPAFDAEAWHQPPDVYELSGRGAEQIRGALAQIPPGVTSEEVRKRLGEPNEIDDGRWVYYAGDRQGGFNFVLVYVRFDPAGRVESATEVPT